MAPKGGPKAHGLSFSALAVMIRALSLAQEVEAPSPQRADGETITAIAPESYDLPVTNIPIADMPIPGVRMSKTKPHHRRTSSRVLDDIAMNPLFELWSEDEDKGRGSSCPRLGAKNWFEENGINIGTAKSRGEVPRVTNDRVERSGMRNGLTDKKSYPVGKGRQNGSAGPGIKNGNVLKSPRNGCVEKTCRNGLTNGVLEKARGAPSVALQKGRNTNTLAQGKGARKVCPSCVSATTVFTLTPVLSLYLLRSYCLASWGQGTCRLSVWCSLLLKFSSCVQATKLSLIIV